MKIMEAAFRINLYRGQNGVIKTKNASNDLDALYKDSKDLKSDIEL